MQDVSRRAKALGEELGGVESELEAALASLPNPPAPSAADADTTLREVGAAGASGRDHLELAGPLIDMEAGARDRRLALRGAARRPRAARAGAGALGDGGARRPRLRAGHPARARARGGAVRHRLPAGHRAADLPAGRRRPVPRRHQRGGARLPARGRDARGGRAAAALRRLLALLPARGGRGRARHARDVPGAPVRQGRDVHVRAPGGLRARARAAAGDRGGAAPGARAARTAWSTSRSTTSAPRR